MRLPRKQPPILIKLIAVAIDDRLQRDGLRAALVLDRRITLADRLNSLIKPMADHVIEIHDGEVKDDYHNDQPTPVEQLKW